MDNCDRLFKPVFDFRRKHPSNFIFAHVNVNSMRHKFASLQEILSKNCLDYFAVSETKLDGSFPNAQFSVKGFNLLCEDNTDTSGGLMVYICSDIPHRRLTTVKYNKDGIESICIEVILGNTKTVIACIYKHPRVKNDVFKTAFCSISDQLFRNCSDAIFIGDMNSDPNKNDVIKDICDMYSLCNLIKGPTCHKAATSTLLDVVQNRIVQNTLVYWIVFAKWVTFIILWERLPGNLPHVNNQSISSIDHTTILWKQTTKMTSPVHHSMCARSSTT